MGHDSVVDGAGVVYTDSLTGNYWADSADDGASWEEHYLSSYQIMDLAVDDAVEATDLSAFEQEIDVRESVASFTVNG